MSRLVRRMGAVAGCALAIAACRHGSAPPRPIDASPTEDGGASYDDGGASYADAGIGEAQSGVDASTDGMEARRAVSAEALSSWCRGATRHPRGAASSVVAPGVVTCREGFALRAERLVASASDGGTGASVITIVHLADGGRTEIVHERRVAAIRGDDPPTVSELEIGDVDGDGLAEVYYGVRKPGRATDAWDRLLLTLRDGKLQPVPLPGGFRANGLSDLDGDGLWDVLTAGPYEEIVHGAAEGERVAFFSEPGPFLLHAVGGFRFATDDAVARTSVRAMCRLLVARPFIDNVNQCGPEPALAAGDADWRDPMEIVCARVAGQDASRVRSAIYGQCKSFVRLPADGDGCFDALLTIANKTPPVRFDASTP